MRPAIEADTGPFAELARRSLDCFNRLSATIESELRLASTIPVPLVPCLRDIWHDHLLLTGDVVTGLIDPAACRTDTVATDLSRLLGSLFGDDSAGWDAAMQVYASHRPLSVAESVLVPILDRSGVLLSAMTWLRRRYIEEPPCESAEIVGRWGTIVARAERM